MSTPRETAVEALSDVNLASAFRSTVAAKVLASLAQHRDDIEDIVMKVRDAYPRRPDDAPSDEIVDAVLALLTGDKP